MFGFTEEQVSEFGVTFGLGDFTLFRLQFVAGTYVAGFGRAMDIEAQFAKTPGV